MSQNRPSWDARAWGARAVVLFKLRVVALLLVVAVGGAVLAAEPWLNHGRAWPDLAVLLLAGLLAAGGASALNEVWERDLDRAMERTQQRPLPRGDIPAALAALLGTGALGLGLLLAAWHRPQLGWAVAAGALIYLVVYTWALKRRTIVNIVIGGAAGSAAVISGAAAVGHWDNPAAWALAALVFLWTPTHFWSLALVYREDYHRAGFPMLPVRVPAAHAVRWVALHTVASVLVALLMAAWPRLGLAYALLVAPPSVYYLYQTWRLWRWPTAPEAKRLFHFSNVYLAWVTLAAVLTALPG
ncbi:MAG: protoheme IX farnesyltransferase [Chloroflexi bacterium]|nr:protoheme IX farnesyltransferase [Chloroflexota bacterium]